MTSTQIQRTPTLEGSTGAPRHAVQFYTESGFLLEELGRFIGTALIAGDAAVVIATKAHRQGLDERLQSRGLDFRVARRQGRYIQMDAAEMLMEFMRRGWPDEARFAERMNEILGRAGETAARRPAHVAVYGEMVSLLWAAGKPEAAVRVEQLWNNLARTRGFSLLCGYPMQAFHRSGHREAFLRICAEHTHVIPAESYTALITEEQRMRRVTQLQQQAVALATEIAERTKVEETLRIREGELSDLLDNAVEGIQQVGADQRIRWANKSLLALLGFAAEDYIGQPWPKFHVHPQVFEEFWRKLLSHEALYDFPAELRCRDGSAKQVRIHSNGHWAGNNLIYARSFIQEAREEK